MRKGKNFYIKVKIQRLSPNPNIRYSSFFYSGVVNDVNEIAARNNSIEMFRDIYERRMKEEGKIPSDAEFDIIVHNIKPLKVDFNVSFLKKEPTGGG